ncbi:MAG TPA: ABC transporter substrate-binding protein [Firmicutes bacterium]|nr:ABC transporter substrate-binding protein [Bacillota bacterium]
MYWSKRIWLGVLLVACFGLVAAGAEVPAVAGAVTITYWHGIAAADREGQEVLVKKFNEQYAGKIQVKMTIMDWGEYYTKVAVAVAAGTAPDVGIMHLDNLGAQSLAGVLRPVDDIFQKLGLTDDDFVGSVSRASIYRGKRWGIPLDVHPLALYYNQDHLDKAGIPGPPKRSSEFLDYARKLTIDRDGDGNPDQWGTGVDTWLNRFYQALRQFGGDYLGGPDLDQPLFAEPPARKAFQYYVDLIYKWKVAPPPSAWQGAQSIFDGRMSFWVDGIWWLTKAQDLRRQGTVNIRVAPSDRVDGDERPSTWAGSHQFVVFKQPKEDPAKIQAITTFIDFMSRNSVIWAAYGQIPVRKAALQADEWREMKDHQIFASQTFAFFPLVPWRSKVIDPVVGGILWNLLVDRKPVDATLEQGKEQAAIEIKKMRAELGI